MGGPGSTRWNDHARKYTVENSCILKMKQIHSSLVPHCTGVITWSKNNKFLAVVRYQVITDKDIPTAIRLSYTWNERDISYLIYINSTPLPWGGRRYWFNCPNSGCVRRIANLYLAPGSQNFACRSCHNLTYKSCQEKGQSDRFHRFMAADLQEAYPGMTGEDLAGFLENRYTDHMFQIILDKRRVDVANLPDPYGEYLTLDAMCKQSNLSEKDIRQLETARILVPDHNGKYRPKLVRWAQKLSYLLSQNWQIDEIKRWARGRFNTKNPKQWPPHRSDWQI
jgi:hypothetical protein